VRTYHHHHHGHINTPSTTIHLQVVQQLTPNTISPSTNETTSTKRPNHAWQDKQHFTSYQHYYVNPLITDEACKQHDFITSKHKCQFINLLTSYSDCCVLTNIIKVILRYKVLQLNEYLHIIKLSS